MTDLPALGARNAVALGLTACLTLVVGLLGWAASASINSAVVAMGEVDAAPARHPVQHIEGGVVEEVLVREGQMAVAGQVLLRLDSAGLRTELEFVEAQIDEAEARLVRLRAERDGLDFPVLPLQTMRDRRLVAALGAQLRLFDARRDTLVRQQAQLRQRRHQAESALAGLVHQREEMETEATILRADLANEQTLLERGLTRSGRVSEIARALARLAGTRAALDSYEAELRGQITEIAMQSVTLLATRREEAEQQYADTGMLQVELQARRAALLARIEALNLRAPASGRVHGLLVTGAEAVLRPAEEVMQIITPVTDPVLTVRVSPDDIDHIDIGQAAMLRFPALAARNLPDLPGTVAAVSGATFVDQRSGARHFRVEIRPTAQAMALLGGSELVPGMSVQAFITTGQQTPLAYLLKPVRDHFARALREP